MEKIVSDVIKIIKGSKNEFEMEKVLWTFLLKVAEPIVGNNGGCCLSDYLKRNWDRLKISRHA
ncbi:hypothetical protein [uncultured Acidaminococcus sp.]|uniref:hypothetical protein n=1 Tax=Acidaminococcus sp. TaxID=1872103 RepID=UPI002674E33C|nr:hypothetical protein [uncultured Acidaminococcus sp.]